MGLRVVSCYSRPRLPPHIPFKASGAARAENASGVTDTEIKIGQTMPYSGPVYLRLWRDRVAPRPPISR